MELLGAILPASYFSIIKRLFIYPEMACFGVYLSPCIPLSFKGEGEDIKKRGFAPLRHPRSKESQRKAKPLLYNNSPSLIKGGG